MSLVETTPATVEETAGTYTSFDGSRLAYRHWPAADQRYAPVVYLHGIESHGGWFAETAQGLARCGVPVFALDRRGSGRNTECRGYVRAYEHLVLDVVSAIQELAEQPAHLVGLSWGGKVVCACTQDYPRYLRSAVLITPGLFPRVGFSGREKLQVLWRWLRNSRDPLPVPLSPELFSDETQVREYIANDELRLTEATPQLFWESRRLDAVVHHTTASAVPVYAILSRPDRIIDMPRVEQWMNALDAPQKQTTVLDQGHALQLECPAVVAEHIAEWIASVEGEVP